MKPNIISISIMIFLLAGFQPLPGQEKFEREISIRSTEAPEQATSFTGSCPFDKKIKWYKEESQDGISYEAKTKFSGKWHSIEFDTLGNVIDVEIKVKPKQLESEQLNKIKNALSGRFDRFKINKIQGQWEASDAILLELIREGTTEGDFAFAYEVVAKGKKGKDWQTYELLIGPEGKVVRELIIVRRATDNIEF